jgi:AAA family ATP:ADP antiporter
MKEPSFFRKYFWPIYPGEYQKFFLMITIFFLISFNYNILRAAKDALIITAPSSGAETIPFIKVWAMLPMAFLMTYIFTRLSNRFESFKVIYIMISIFLVFYGIFTFVLYPLRNQLEPHHFVERLSSILPLGFKGLLAIFQHWTLAAFYVMSELWGVVVLSVLFFGFSNNITTVDEAKRFYALFGVGANIGGALSGQAAMHLSRHTFSSWIPYGSNSWDQSVLLMNLTVIFLGICILLLFRRVNNLSKKTFMFAPIEKGPKMSLRKTFKYLASSNYLICIALIVVTYNITINLTEVLWKNQIRLLYPNAADYSSYMGKVMTAIGIIATIIALFLSGNMLRKFKWTIPALFTPVIVLITGVLFFATFVFQNNLPLAITSFLGMSPLMMNVFFGSMQNTMARASKYTVFDATKEITFIPLDKETKTKGKAAIDGIGSRLGKSGGAVIYQGLLLLCSTLSQAAPYVAIIFLVVVTVWIIAVRVLGNQFEVLTKQKEGIQEKDLALKKEEKTTSV